MFNPKSTPYGITFQELKTHTSTIAHAFRHGAGPVLTRETQSTPRYPLKTLFGLSPVAMIASRNVFPQIQDQMEIVLYKELERQIKGILSGAIPTS
jgi:hypothetical protein